MHAISWPGTIGPYAIPSQENRRALGIEPLSGQAQAGRAMASVEQSSMRLVHDAKALLGYGSTPSGQGMAFEGLCSHHPFWGPIEWRGSRRAPCIKADAGFVSVQACRLAVTGGRL